jgi:uracil-DNA glycosylase
MLIGQAPGPRANERGLPWAGASGTLLRSWFARAGFDPARFLDDWYLTSLTKCFPGKAPGGTGDRVPSRAELALCRPFLEAEIALVQPGLVVTLGRVAANAIVPGAKSLTLKDLVGTVHEVDLGYGPVPVVPLPHPSGVARWLNLPANRSLVDIAMAKLGVLRASLPLAAGDGSRRPGKGSEDGFSQARNDGNGDGASKLNGLK